MTEHRSYSLHFIPYSSQEGLEYQDSVGLFDFERNPHHRFAKANEGEGKTLFVQGHSPPSIPIWSVGPNGLIADTGPGPHFPIWQTSPVFDEGGIVNVDFNHFTTTEGADESFNSKSVVISKIVTAPPGGTDSDDPDTSFFARLLSTARGKKLQYKGDPMSNVFFPIFNSFDDNRKSVAIMVAYINWASYFTEILPSNIKGIDVVLGDSCGHMFTYRLNGEDVNPVGDGDLHQKKYGDMRRSASFESIESIEDGTRYGVPLNHRHCEMVLDVYPSAAFYEEFASNTPVVITVSVLFVFVFTVLMFIAYDRLVEKRQAIVMTKARQTTAIVTSLFPQKVADRLIEANETIGKSLVAPTRRLKSFLTGSEEDDIGLQPIADLFPDCTVMFADISGFTAWSSTRDPAQVFILLQTVYQAFDVIAKRRKVFKVETIGDSYVAVTGLPEPQVSHAVIMAR